MSEYYMGIDIAKPESDKTVIYLSDGKQLWNLEPLEINGLEVATMALYAELLATAFGIPVDLLRLDSNTLAKEEDRDGTKA